MEITFEKLSSIAFRYINEVASGLTGADSSLVGLALDLQKASPEVQKQFKEYCDEFAFSPKNHTEEGRAECFRRKRVLLDIIKRVQSE